MRIALGVTYVGSAYHGWQRQKHTLATVQNAVETSLSDIAATPIHTVCAGRTDAGVHACYQVIHFDSPVSRPMNAWVQGVNSRLPADISVLWSVRIADDFHARFSATCRHYRYVIDNRPVRCALSYQRAYHHRKQLNEQLMSAEAQALVGEHDFSSFRAAACQSHSAHRHIFSINVCRDNNFVCVDICANAFLLHMVRNIVAVLVAVGDGRRPSGDTMRTLLRRDRRYTPATLSTHGLYLMAVDYPAYYQLPPANQYTHVPFIALDPPSIK